MAEQANPHSAEEMARALSAYAKAKGVACVAVPALDGLMVGLFDATGLIVESRSSETLACRIDALALIRALGDE